MKNITLVLSRLYGGMMLSCIALLVSGCYDTPTYNPPTVYVPINSPAPPSPEPDPVIPAPRPPDGRNYRTNEFRSNYGLSPIQAEAAYQRGYFGQNVVVGVVDTGVRTTHTELDGNVVSGRDFVFPGRTMTDPDGHGTAVAAVIAGERDSRGMHGVAPRANIMPLKIGDDNGRLVGNWISAFHHAASRNVKIINNSFGDIEGFLIGDYAGGNIYRAEVPFLRGFNNDASRNQARSVLETVRNRDTVLVWAAGNGGWNSETGRVNMYRCTRYDLRYCNNNPEFELTTRQFAANFVSQNHYDYSGNFVSGYGLIADTDGSTASDLSSYYSSLPIWTIRDIDSLLIRAEQGTITEQQFVEQFTDKIENDRLFIDTIFKHVAVVATNRYNRIVSFSDGCGFALAWCLAAPGHQIYTANSTGDVTYDYVNGTSFAAPHVSGALALLKSRLPSMPMQQIVAIMLLSAEDKGEPGPDFTYGWGLLNVEAAITLQGNLEMLLPNSAAVRLQNAHIELPSEFAHVKTQLQSANVAVQGIGNAYYNQPLSELVHVNNHRPVQLGDAAKDMLSPADYHADNGFLFAARDREGQFKHVGAQIQQLGGWRFQHDFCDDCQNSPWHTWNSFTDNDQDAAAPFFAENKNAFALRMRGDGLRPFAAFGGDLDGGEDSPYRQYGLRWQHNNKLFGFLTEASRIDESESFLGANFGTFGGAKSQTRQERIRLHGDLTNDWRGFAEYQRANTDADIGGGFLDNIRNVRAHGWTTGMEADNVFHSGDQLRLFVNRKTAVQSGQAVFRYYEATGNFAEAVLQSAGLSNYQQTLNARELAVDLSAPPTTTFAAGYAIRFDNAQLAFGAEYETHTNNAAFSTQLNMAF